jgi:hypothetical protein
LGKNNTDEFTMLLATPDCVILGEGISTYNGRLVPHRNAHIHSVKFVLTPRICNPHGPESLYLNFDSACVLNMQFTPCRKQLFVFVVVREPRINEREENPMSAMNNPSIARKFIPFSKSPPLTNNCISLNNSTSYRIVGYVVDMEDLKRPERGGAYVRFPCLGIESVFYSSMQVDSDNRFIIERLRYEWEFFVRTYFVYVQQGPKPLHAYCLWSDPERAAPLRVFGELSRWGSPSPLQYRKHTISESEVFLYVYSLPSQHVRQFTAQQVYRY